jgi:acylphosphatase
VDRVDDSLRLTLLVQGRVQGVGFRVFVRRSALDLGLSGYAENLWDGRVEVVAEGPRSELNHLVVLLRNGPTHAVVTEVEMTWGEAGKLAGFFTY